LDLLYFWTYGTGSNSLTLVSEAEIQPFEKVGSNFRTKDMHLYELPWPRDILENLGEEKVEMRITLSYFIEPGPGDWDGKIGIDTPNMDCVLSSIHLERIVKLF